MKTLFLAWQDHHSRRWFPVGRLTAASPGYLFEYVRGVEDAQRQGFEPLPSFKHVDQVYEATELFPLFGNRVLSASRPDYQAFLGWLQLPATPTPSPLEVLARSGGQRLTDHLEVFPAPSPVGSGIFESHFFVHGLRHMPAEAVDRANLLAPGDRLYLMHDFQNDKDAQALALRSPEAADNDMHLLGYTPRYLFGDVFDSMERGPEWPKVTVEQINPAPAPVRFRILCRVRMRLKDGIEPFSSEQFQPISATVAA